MKRWLWAALLVGVAGCAKCGAGATVDAGPPDLRDVALRPERKSTDLRTALVQMYPEYRDTALLDAEVKLTRTIPGLTPASRDEALTALRWQVSDAGSGWDLNKFHLEQAGPDALVLRLPLSVEDVGHLFLSPTSLSSMELALYLPRQLPVGRENFEVQVHYATSPERALVRVRQAVSLLVANGQWRISQQPLAWSPDAADDPSLPDEFEVQVTGPEGTRLSFQRARGQVTVHLTLETVAPR